MTATSVEESASAEGGYQPRATKGEPNPPPKDPGEIRKSISTMECRVIIEVCEGGYLVTRDRRDIMPIRSVHTQLGEALMTARMHLHPLSDEEKSS